jgi:hypothetical protein
MLEPDDLDEVVGTNLGWLEDASPFIDGERIESFYHTVVSPSYQEQRAKPQMRKNTSKRIRAYFGFSFLHSQGSRAISKE